MEQSEHLCSPRLSDLRKAARQIDLEDSQDCTLALQEAARSVARESGIKLDRDDVPSVDNSSENATRPKRSTSPTTTSNKSKKAESTAEVSSATPGGRRKSVMDDASALASQMNLKMEPVKSEPAVAQDITSEEATEADVAALIKLVRLNSREIEETHKASEPKKVDASYLNKLNRRRSSSPQLKQHSYNSTLAFEPSRISTLLQSTDDTPSSLFKSHYEEVLFRSMQRITDTKKRPKSAHRPKPATYNRLAQPKHSSTSEKYALDDDKANCTFKPKINKKNRSEGDGEGGYSFVDRQYDEFKKHLEEMYYAQQQAEYDKLVDKKICPVCKATQKYDEIREKRKLCPTCKEPYQYKVNWSKVAKNFYDRQKKAAEKAQVEKENLLKSLNEEQLRGTRRMYRNGQVVEVAASETRKWDAEMEADFFKRMEETEQRKEIRLKELEEEIYGQYRPEESKKAVKIEDEGDFLSSMQRSTSNRSRK